MTEDRFEQLLNEIRDEPAPAEEVAAARERVWHKLVSPVAAACTELQPQFDEYRAERLSEARRLLIEDHLSRCADCRRVMAEGQGERKVYAMPAAQHVSGFSGRATSRFSGWTRWAVAAGVLLAALYTGRDRIDTAMAPSGPRATVVAVSGNLYRLAAGSLQAGAALNEGEVVRTGAGTRAKLRLADGSMVEVNERSELAVHAAWSGQWVDLSRGDLIVQAAKQRRGHLRVITRDSVASVKGTVFAVSSGSSGSLVSVVEGSVEVKQPGTNRVLSRGQQAATGRALNGVPVREAVSWSEDAEKYYALLAEFMNIEKQLAQMPEPAPRTQSALLRYLPQNTIVYGAIPNISGTLREAYGLIEGRSRESAVLGEWWNSKQGEQFKLVLENLRVVTPLMGDEIVFLLTKPPVRSHPSPVILAQVQPGRRAALQEAITRIVKDQADDFTYQLTDELILITDSAASLSAIQSQLGKGVGSDFANEIAQRYKNGVGWLVGIDVTAIDLGAKGDETLAMLGIPKMRHVFLDLRSLRGQADTEATLTFQGNRTGVVSWLANPGAAGSSEYIAGDAVFALSASTKNPRQAFDELINLAGATGRFTKELREVEREAGVSIASDIAGALGTDLTFIIEKPTIPIPAWTAAVEVVHPAALDDAVRRVMDAANRHAGSGQNEQGMALATETVNGRTWMTVKNGAGTSVFYWTYDRGYLLLGMDRAVVSRAIATRENGIPLVRSAKFQEQIPGSRTVHNSGFVWLNTDGALSGLAEFAPSPALKNLMRQREPMLIVLNGETERIHAGSRTRLTGMLLDLMMIGGGPDDHVKGNRQAPKVLKQIN